MNGREGRVYAIAECRKYETKITQDRVYVLGLSEAEKDSHAKEKRKLSLGSSKFLDKST
jgi:hypothetical protein